MGEDEFCPSGAQWCGLFDRLENPSPSEIERRASLARKGKARS